MLTKHVLYQLSHISKYLFWFTPPLLQGRGADNQIRTGDLMLTKHVLYQLSHISILRVG